MHADGKSTLASVSKWNSGKVSCEILAAFQQINRGNYLRPTENVTILVKGNYHQNDYLFQLSSKRHNYLLNNTFKWLQGEQAVSV